jgi:hypothetical protein
MVELHPLRIIKYGTDKAVRTGKSISKGALIEVESGKEKLVISVE